MQKTNLWFLGEKGNIDWELVMRHIHTSLGSDVLTNKDLLYNQGTLLNALE